MRIQYYGNPNSDTVIIQPADIRDDSPESELALITENTGKDILIAAVFVDDWNNDLSPWEAPAVFGNENFGCGAVGTLDYIINDVIPEIMSPSKKDSDERKAATKKLYLGGYSLAGLFSLWAAYNTDKFDGIAAVSPSVWFPGFMEYVEGNKILTPKVYLSIGDKEEKVRSSVISKVGDNLREIHRLLTSLNVETVLEYNPGNHFRDPDIRVSKGFSYLIS